MTELDQLSITINKLNDIWPLLDGDEKNSLLDERDRLDELASELAHKTINQGEPALLAAIDSLKEATRMADDVKTSIDDLSVRAEKVAKLVKKTSKAALKVSGLIALL